MLEHEKPAFDTEAYLASAGLGRIIVKLHEKQTFFSQGAAADSIFYLQSGRAKLTVVAKNGKEATITLLSAGEFVGEESPASVGALHMATATADCTALKIERGRYSARCTGSNPLLLDSSNSFLLAACASSPILSTNSSTPAKSDWRGYSC
jgi:CRP-like cAMP-binding protein